MPELEVNKITFDEYGNKIQNEKVRNLRSKLKEKTFKGSNSSLKSRINSRILKSDRKKISKLNLNQNSNKIKNITSNIDHSKNSENIYKSNINPVTSTHSQHIEINFQNGNKKYQTSIESQKQLTTQNNISKNNNEQKFEQTKDFPSNIKITESNIHFTNSKKKENKKSPKSKNIISDPNFINALKSMKESITQIKRKGVNELKNKNDNSWMSREENEDLAAIKAGLGGDVSRVHMISNFSVISDFDKSGDTLLNLEKYLGGLSNARGKSNEDLKVSNDELPKLKFLLEKLRLVLGKGI